MVTWWPAATSGHFSKQNLIDALLREEPRAAQDRTGESSSPALSGAGYLRFVHADRPPDVAP